MSGEFRFRKGYSKSNPRKMVAVWAEKEMRNLLRLRLAHLPVPQPHYLRRNVLVMDFLGKNGWCSFHIHRFSFLLMLFKYRLIISIDEQHIVN